MRLINVKTFQLEEFFDLNTPPYAVLSHRWDLGHEVSLAAFNDGSGKNLRGWSKIIKFCELTSSLNYDYAWVDTCCIDKSSSADLSESINSMYQWYNKSGICIVYLSDVCNYDRENLTEFEKSKWFTRGWTLQELLAPRQLRFYNNEWAFIGDRTDLKAVVSKVTNIAVEFLEDPYEASIAQRFSWASERSTTRGEDTAYCLMGLFNVHMPLLYGEGLLNAFYRLQLEIIQKSTDESIFAWNPSNLNKRGGMLASCPAQFSRSGNIRNHWFIRRQPYRMTNAGLRIDLRLYPYFPLGPQGSEVLAVLLNCSSETTKRPVTIFLLRHSIRRNWFCRVGDFFVQPPRTLEPFDCEVYIDADGCSSKAYWGLWEGWCRLEDRDKIARTEMTDYWSTLLDNEIGTFNISVSKKFAYRMRELFEWNGIVDKMYTEGTDRNNLA